MPFIQKEEAFAAFLKHGRNSSHFVWFLANLKFYRTKNDWIFGIVEKDGITLFALEPLIPDESSARGENIAAFIAAWNEIEAELKPKISFFISVYEPFLRYLQQLEFQSLKVGREPFVALKDCIPTGKSSKGVRAARNQALRSGVRVEEWSHERILNHPTLKQNMLGIMRVWKQRNLVDLGGFMNKVDPFAYMEFRRYFIAFSEKDLLEAFLVVTPIPGKNGFFMEDMVVRPGAQRGTGELLTLESLVALSESGKTEASLGVVSLTNMDDAASSSHNLPKATQFLMIALPKYLQKFLNVGGLEVFRKRFKPHRWENIHLALRNEKKSGVSDSKAWLLGLLALLKAFQPQFRLTPAWLFHAVSKPLRRYPISYSVLALSSLLFACVNHFGKLPAWALDKFAFSGSSPLIQWSYRSVISDFLYFDAWHFYLSSILLIALIRWSERCYSAKFVGIYLAVLCVFDDIFNQLVLIRPYEFFQHRIFEKLMVFKDVGGSLWISTLIGLQLCQLRRNREVFFAVLSMGTVLAFAFSSAHLVNLVLNLNHFLFLAFGFITGKLRFEYERSISRKNAKQKPPVAKCVQQMPSRKSRNAMKTQAPAPDAANGAPEEELDIATNQ